MFCVIFQLYLNAVVG